MSTLVSDSLVFAKRNAQHIRQIPEKLLDVTLQPLMFVLLFAYVFGGVIHIPGSNYKEYLLGGILVQTLAFGMMGPGVSINSDLSEGVVDRFRSLPVARGAYLIGHLISELGAAMVGLTVMLVTGLIIGWRVHEDVPHFVAGLALLVLFSSAMIWTGTLLGIVARSTDAVQGLMFMTVFPLTFLSNAFVPTGSLPGGLREIANWNPVSAVVAAVRDLFGNARAVPRDAPWPLEHPVVAAVGWSLLILAVVVPLTLARYKQRTTD